MSKDFWKDFFQHLRGESQAFLQYQYTEGKSSVAFIFSSMRYLKVRGTNVCIMHTTAHVLVLTGFTLKPHREEWSDVSVYSFHFFYLFWKHFDQVSFHPAATSY